MHPTNGYYQQYRNSTQNTGSPLTIQTLHPQYRKSTHDTDTPPTIQEVHSQYSHSTHNTGSSLTVQEVHSQYRKSTYNTATLQGYKVLTPQTETLPCTYCISQFMGVASCYYVTYSSVTMVMEEGVIHSSLMWIVHFFRLKKWDMFTKFVRSIQYNYLLQCY